MDPNAAGNTINTIENAAVTEMMMAIRKLTRSSLMLQHSIASKINLNVTDAEVIDYLMEMGPSTAGALAKATFLTTGAITNVIDRLERAGAVKREKDPHDRRKVIVIYTPKKDNPAGAYYGAMARDVAAHLSAYKEKDLKFLLEHTLALTSIFQKHTEKVQED